MKPRRWSLTVHDARGRRHRGAVTWTDAIEAPLTAPAPPSAFHIAIVATDAAVDPPERTAICVPAERRLRAVGDDAEFSPPRRIDELAVPPHRMAEFAAGRIIMAAGVVDPADIFPVHAERPRFDRLALAIVEAAEADAIAPYTAMVRHVLALPPNADALAELRARLRPADSAQRPPSRAPGIMRLTRALKRLDLGRAPDDAIEQFADDLRFLRLFDGDEPVLSPAGARRLREDLLRAPARPAKILPLRRRDDA